ncbi:MAG TPA: dipeptide ABC transporter ATP-binding protein [Aliidongia sp.]|nr:dipeptide ABC transporter ATP-binding protein [Aliidongia sp.]
MSNSAPLLTVRDLRVHFPVTGGMFAEKRVVKAVDGVSFDLYPGETLGIVGESGCGKSTLGRAVLNLIPSTAGRVVWLGRDLAEAGKRGLRALRQEMQIIFQDPLAALDPRMTVGAIIAEPIDTFEPGLPREAKQQRVSEAMERVGLSPTLINRYPHEFSGGQCQRIGIARAMILKPKLIVCDEPVSALDVSIQAQIINLLRRIQREENLALIFISHNLSVVRIISKRVMVLYLGKVMELAERDEIYRNPRHPYTQALLSAVPVPDPDFERTKKRISLTGDLPSPINPPSGCVFRTRCPLAIDICAEKVPALDQAAEGHVVACHRWREAISLLAPTLPAA